MANAEAPEAMNEPFTPYKGKIRKSGTGCIYQITEHLWEGSYSPTHADGQRHKHNVYAQTREEVEVKLKELIAKVRKEIKEEKKRMKEGHAT